jgi:hypothetical protein
MATRVAAFAPARAVWSLAVTAAGASAAVLYRFPPLQVHWYPRCPLYVLTGIYCPGCGALRAGHELLHGHLDRALGYNALLVLSLPFLAWALAAQAGEAIAGRPVLPAYRLSGRQTKVVMWTFILFMVLRNIPLYPFTLLAP